jgi:hypothetical protein
MGESARQLAASEHDLERAAELYAAALAEAAGGEALLASRSVEPALAENGAVGRTLDEADI